VYPGDEHTVAGDVRVLRGVGNAAVAARDVLVYLPPSYATATWRRYPVLYLQDGQNVFDAATSYAGEWGADETAGMLAGRGLEAILVAIPNAGKDRADEYSPFPLRPPSSRRNTQADAYLDYLLTVVKPAVDTSFRTDSTREGSGIAGSSLGGLIALYACLERPTAFGFCAALSPALWPGRGRIFEIARGRREKQDPRPRVYLDAGQNEAGERFVTQVRRMRDLLRDEGYDVAYVEDMQGQHNEESWRRRFPAVLTWFLDPGLRPDDDGQGVLPGVPL